MTNANGNSKPRPILPSLPGGPSSTNRQHSPPGPRTKRKRSVVPAACQNCRKRKVKCDGVRPICAPCTSSKATCEYAVPEGLSQRDADRQRMDSVSKAAQDLRTILDLLRRGRDCESAEILRQIRGAERLDDAVSRIADASILLPMGAFSGSDSGSSSGGRYSPGGQVPHGRDYLRENRRIMSPFDKPEHIFESLFERSFRDGEDPGMDPGFLGTTTVTLLLPVSRWTEGSRSLAGTLAGDQTLTHLLTLFWTWDNTFSRVFDREMFLEDMRDRDPETPTPIGARLEDVVFCTQFLVNCMLAVGCLYSTRPEIYDVLDDHNSRGRRFADEAKRLLEGERGRPSLTLMQGVALLWLWEGSVGDGAVAEGYVEDMYRYYFGIGLDRLALPAGPLPAADSRRGKALQATSHILWGFYYLNAKIGLNFSARLRVPRPRLPKTFEWPEYSYLTSPSSPCFHWCAYPVNFKLYPSHFCELLAAECVFAELVDEVMAEVGRGEEEDPPRVDMGALLRYEKVYARLIRWKELLPEYLLANNTTLPSVLSLHATFDMALLKLLTPLSSVFPNDKFYHSSPSALKLAGAFSLIGHIWTFRALYTLKHEYWLMQSCFTAAQAVLFDVNRGSADVFVRACQGLHEMGEFLKLANKFLKIIQELITKFGIQIPEVGRSVRSKYFTALEGRKTTKYLDQSRVMVHEDGGRVKDLKVADVVASTQELDLSVD